MTSHSLLLADAGVRRYLGMEPLFPVHEPWQWLLVVLLGACGLVLIGILYYFDGVELPPGITALLATLRVFAMIGLFVFFVNPVVRSEREIVKNSRVSLLLDTSLSMGLRDAQSTSVPAAPSRSERIAAELGNGSLIQQLRQQHDVVVYRFDQQPRPTQIASYPKTTPLAATVQDEQIPRQRQAAALSQSRSILLGGGGVLLLAILLGAACVLTALRADAWKRTVTSWLLFACGLFLLASLVLTALADLRGSDLPLLAILGLSSADGSQQEPDPAIEPEESEPVEIQWNAELLPRGTETRLGDAVRYVVNRERGGPIAGILLVTDGQNNEGIDYGAAVTVASDAQIPIYAIGMGSITRPVNVRVVDLEAPRRVYPGDKFTVTGLLQSYGLEGRPVELQLVSTREDDPDQIERFEDEAEVTLVSDGKEVSAEFEISPEAAEGRRIYTLRVQPPKQDRDAHDNQLGAIVEVVQRKNRVLLIAGGPTRDFRFLRSQLYREEETELSVWLQTAQSDSAYAVGRETPLLEFPSSEDELFQFDCLVAFDPDWRMLTEQQTELLERWISEKAGGMIVIAGPVYTPLWTRHPRGQQRADTLRGLYPVSFFNQGSATIKIGRFGGDQPWPIAFTREGRSADFLRLKDALQDSVDAWNSFAGVYGYYAVNDPKPGAAVYGRFSDPATAGGPNNELPIYMAGHFYGAGRVFFQASGEMWRLRAVDEGLFETYYTKLIRWASQGRLLRDSLRGVLLVDKDRCILGDHIEVRSILTDARHLPLAAQDVAAVLIQPDSTRLPLSLKQVKDGARLGTFAGSFTATQEGDYRIALAVPDSDTGELLTRDVRVRMPDKEIERPQRNDKLLTDVAEATRGVYYVGIEAATNPSDGRPSVYDAMVPQDQTTYLAGTPDANFATKLMGWLLVLVCGTLATEWLMRRLSKLA